MDAADEKIPVGHAAQFFDPRFAAGEEIAFEPEADGELRESARAFSTSSR